MELTNLLTEMNFRLERQDAQIREMTRVLADVGSVKTCPFNRERLMQEFPLCFFPRFTQHLPLAQGTHTGVCALRSQHAGSEREC